MEKYLRIVPFVALFALSNCSETIYEEVIKLDTVFLSRPVNSLVSLPATSDTVIIRDTVKVEVIIRDTIINNIYHTDTLIQVVTKDSLIIKVVEKEVFIRDTIVITNTVKETITLTDTITIIQYDRTVVYLDTAYVMIYMRNVTSIPQAIQPHVNEFYALASQYGKITVGGHMIVQYTDDLPGENWVSHSYWIGGPVTSTNPYGQMVIEISESLPPEQHRASILRELARLQLKKKYVTDVNKINCPLFPPTQPITTTNLNELFTLPI